MEIKRIYRGTDSNMLSRISTVIHFFSTHLSDFTAFDPSLDATYLANWKAADDEAGHLHVRWDWKTENVVTEDEFLIEKSKKALKQCQKKYKDVKYFAGKAFPDNKEALKEFGMGQYRKVYSSALRMVQFMETLHGVATKYKIELIANNYTQAAIDEIATLTDTLRNDNNTQQLKKKERPTVTRKRIEALNTLYSFGQPVWEAAQEIFRDNPTVRDEFRLALRHHPKVTKSWFTLGVSETRKTALPKLLKKFNVTLTNQGKETIEYWRAENINETPLQKYLLEAGKSADINQGVPIRKFLIVKNTSQKEVRMMLKKEVKEPLNPLKGT